MYHDVSCHVCSAFFDPEHPLSHFRRLKQVFYPQQPFHITNKIIVSLICESVSITSFLSAILVRYGAVRYFFRILMFFLHFFDNFILQYLLLHLGPTFFS